MSSRDMDVFALGDGLYVTEDGEIIGETDDGGALAVLAARIAGWQEQIRGYERCVAAAKAAVLKRATDKRTVAGDYVCDVRQNTRRVPDVARQRMFIDHYLNQLTEDNRASVMDLYEAAYSALQGATSFDPKLVPDEVIAENLAACVDEVPSKPYVVVSPVLRDAPVPLRMPRPESEASA